MKRTALAIVIMMLAFAGSASAGGIAAIPWNRSRIQTLQSLDKADILAFFNEHRRESFVSVDKSTGHVLLNF